MAQRALAAQEAIVTAVGNAAERLIRSPGWEDANAPGPGVRRVVVVVVAGVDHEAALVVLDQDRIDRKADLAAGSLVPPDVEPVEHERAVIGFDRQRGVRHFAVAEPAAQDPEHWRDCMVEVRGCIAANLQSAFAQLWGHTTGELLAGPHFFPRDEETGAVDAAALPRRLRHRRRDGPTASRSSDRCPVSPWADGEPV